MKAAVASPPYPQTLKEGLRWVETLAKDAAKAGADIVCFPESYLPGYPLAEEKREKCSRKELQAALDTVRDIAARYSIAVIIPMDWYLDGDFYNVAHVISKSGKLLGLQTKNQLDPSEDSIWKAGTERQIFKVEGVKFGISICHEGFRYPETVRWAARNGASVVFHPNLTGSNVQGGKLKSWGHATNPYYEKAQMVRAMENTIYFAPSNYSLRFPGSASSVIAPDGKCIVHQKYGKSGIVVAEIDPKLATGLLASRFKPQLYSSAV